MEDRNLIRAERKWGWEVVLEEAAQEVGLQ